VRPIVYSLNNITINGKTYFSDIATRRNASMPIIKTLGFTGIKNNIKVTGISITLIRYQTYIVRSW